MGKDLTGGNSDSNTDGLKSGMDRGFDDSSTTSPLPEIIDPDMINSYLL